MPTLNPKSAAKHPIPTLAIVVAVIASIYWLAIASDRYVSEAHVIIQRTASVGAAENGVASLLLNGADGSRSQQLLLRDHLLSTDMLFHLDEKHDLRGHYSDKRMDRFSRLESADISVEDLHKYYLSRTKVEYDDYAGILVIRVQAYTPEFSKLIAEELVAEGERFMNQLAADLAQSQVSFMELQVNRISEQLSDARKAVLAYQNENKLVSPKAATESMVQMIAELETKRVALETERNALRAYLIPEHPKIIQINQQLKALQKQIAKERTALASTSGTTLNSKLEEFQTLELQAQFALDMYQSALTALEQGRIEASRTLRKVSILQKPTLPERSTQPRRFYNTFVFVTLTLLLAGVFQMLFAIISDHKD